MRLREDERSRSRNFPRSFALNLSAPTGSQKQPKSISDSGRQGLRDAGGGAPAEDDRNSLPGAAQNEQCPHPNQNVGHAHTKQGAMFVIKQTPKNVRDNNKQREDYALHVQVRCGGDQSRCSDDSCLREAAGQEMNERMLQGAPQDDLLQNANRKVQR
jgi:hypothetical protein